MKRPNSGFFMSLVTDPLTKRLTFVVPLGRLPKGFRIRKAKKYNYLVCTCGAKRRFTLFLAGKSKAGPFRRAACVGIATWMGKHHCEEAAA